MNVNSSMPYTTFKSNERPAKVGAAVTAGFLSGSTALAWTTRKPDMLQVVKDCGGKAKYVGKFAGGMLALSALGALTSVFFSKLGENVKPSNTPKAVN